MSSITQPDHVSVIRMLLKGYVPGLESWWSVDEDGMPTYSYRDLTDGEQISLKVADPKTHDRLQNLADALRGVKK